MADLRSEFIWYKFAGLESMATHKGRILYVAQKLKDARFKLTPIEIAFQMLRKWPPEYRQLATLAYHWDDVVKMVILLENIEVKHRIKVT